MSIRIGVVGAGGVGGYFAHRWAEAGLDVTALARGRHLKAIQDRGLTILSPLGDSTVSLHATDDPSALASADLILFATKTWQLPAALSEMGKSLGGSGLVMGLQNGVESTDVLSEAVGPERVLGGTCRILSFVEEPGVIRHLGVQPTITFGEPAGGISTRVRELGDLLGVEGKTDLVSSDDIQRDLWRKFLFFSAVSGVSAVKRGTIGDLRSHPDTRSLLRSAVHETAAIGRALGIALEAGAEEEALSFLDRVPADGTSSMQRDFEGGRRSELDALSGYVSRRGRELGIATPTHDSIYDTLLPLERKARTNAGPRRSGVLDIDIRVKGRR